MCDCPQKLNETELRPGFPGTRYGYNCCGCLQPSFNHAWAGASDDLGYPLSGQWNAFRDTVLGQYRHPARDEYIPWWHVDVLARYYSLEVTPFWRPCGADTSSEPQIHAGQTVQIAARGDTFLNGFAGAIQTDFCYYSLPLAAGRSLFSQYACTKVRLNFRRERGDSFEPLIPHTGTYRCELQDTECIDHVHTFDAEFRMVYGSSPFAQAGGSGHFVDGVPWQRILFGNFQLSAASAVAGEWPAEVTIEDEAAAHAVVADGHNTLFIGLIMPGNLELNGQVTPSWDRNNLGGNPLPAEHSHWSYPTTHPLTIRAVGSKTSAAWVRSLQLLDAGNDIIVEYGLPSFGT